MYTYLNFRFISNSVNEKYVVRTAAAIVKRFNRPSYKIFGLACYRFQMFCIDTAGHDLSKTFLTVKLKGQHPHFLLVQKYYELPPFFSQYLYIIIYIYSSHCCLYCCYNEHRSRLKNIKHIIGILLVYINYNIICRVNSFYSPNSYMYQCFVYPYHNI